MSQHFGILVAVASLLPLVTVAAQDVQVGQPAPAFAIEKCVHGKPIANLAKGVTHVVHFWGQEPGSVFDTQAKFAALQKQFGDKVNVVAVLQDSDDYDFDAVQTFYQENDAKPTFAIAWDVAGAAHSAWVSAANQEAAVVFLVAADGKLAWIGGVGFLDLVLDKVVAGKADPKALQADTDKAMKQFTRVLLVASLKPEGARAELDKLLKDYPALAPIVVPAVYNSLAEEAEGVEHAIAMQPLLCDVLIKSEDVESLNGLAWSIVDPAAEVSKRDLVTAAKAAKKAVELTKEKDAAIVDTYARVFFWQKDYVNAVAWQQKAVKLEPAGEAHDELAATLKEYEQLAAGK